MRTALTDLLGIEHPVMLAGMGGVSYAPLAAAVSNAGGIGTLGASTMGAAQMVDQIAEVAAATDRPFGVDLLTASPQDMVAKVRAIAEGGGSVFVAGLGVPSEVIDLCHELGVVVASMCGKVSHAVRATDAGCDLVIAQGTEAGGHTGQIATMALVPQVVDAVGDRVPVVAAGGLFDGRGLAAALALGAAGVWMGTRFIATPEAQAVTGYKDRILASAEDGTQITRAYTGKTCRVLRTPYASDFEASGGVPEPFPMQVLRSMEDGVNHLGGDADTAGIDPENEFMPAGQAIGAIDSLVPAGDLVRSIVAEAEQALDRLDALR